MASDGRAKADAHAARGQPQVPNPTRASRSGGAVPPPPARPTTPPGLLTPVVDTTPVVPPAAPPAAVPNPLAADVREGRPCERGHVSVTDTLNTLCIRPRYRYTEYTFNI